MNRLVGLYRSAYDILTSAVDTDTENASFRMELISGRDRRTENLPTADEVAMFIADERSA